MKEIIYTVVIDNCGTYWLLNGNYHRINGPAMKRYDCSKFWYINGELHRLDGPACEFANGDKHWYINGYLHRTNGPAIEYDGSEKWFLNGKEYCTNNKIFKILSHSNCYLAN